MLSDSICASTCSIFMEMMHHDAGVRTVVAGGLPLNGPMQAPRYLAPCLTDSPFTNHVESLTRGASSYKTETLDRDIDFARRILEYFDEDSNFIQNRTLDSRVISAGINLRDQVRKGGDIPLQFLYEGADCRIFYTPETVYNYTALWQYAADAMWNDPQKCVTGSMGYSSVNGTKTAAPAQDILPPANSGPPVKMGAHIAAIIANDDLKAEPATSSAEVIKSYDGTPCNSKHQCREDYYCFLKFKLCDDGKMKTVPTCLDRCATNEDDTCDVGRYCQALPTKKNPKYGAKSSMGYCTQANAPTKNSCKTEVSTDDEISQEDQPKSRPPEYKT
jgi:hypothetical protein